VVERLARRTHAEDDEVVDLALLFRLHPLVGIVGAVRAVAARDHAGDLGGDVGDLEGIDLLGAALALDQARPGRFDAAAERRDHSHSGDDDTSHDRLRAEMAAHAVMLARPSRKNRCARQRTACHRGTAKRARRCRPQLFAFFSRNFTASPTVRIVSAASSGISHPNSSSKAITSSTVSRLSAPRSSIKLAWSVTLSGSTPRCSTTIFFTRSAISLIVQPLLFRLGRNREDCSRRYGLVVVDGG